MHGKSSGYSREILELLPTLRRLWESGTQPKALCEGLSRVDFLLMYPIVRGVRLVGALAGHPEALAAPSPGTVELAFAPAEVRDCRSRGAARRRSPSTWRPSGPPSSRPMMPSSAPSPPMAPPRPCSSTSAPGSPPLRSSSSVSPPSTPALPMIGRINTGASRIPMAARPASIASAPCSAKASPPATALASECPSRLACARHCPTRPSGRWRAVRVPPAARAASWRTAPPPSSPTTTDAKVSGSFGRTP